MADRKSRAIAASVVPTCSVKDVRADMLLRRDMARDEQREPSPTGDVNVKTGLSYDGDRPLFMETCVCLGGSKRACCGPAIERNIVNTHNTTSMSLITCQSRDLLASRVSDRVGGSRTLLHLSRCMWFVLPGLLGAGLAPGRGSATLRGVRGALGRSTSLVECWWSVGS